MYRFSTAMDLAAMLIGSALAVDNGFGRTPVMGFNTYNDVSCNIDERYIEDTIMQLAQQDFPAYGYRYFQPDCGWQGYERDADGAITYDAELFPHGMLPLSDLATSKGMYWSMYTDSGIYACDIDDRKRVGSLGFEEKDAAVFAKWNTTLVKVDSCWPNDSEFNPHEPRSDFISRYGDMWDALRHAGIPGQAMCQWGVPRITSDGLQGPSDWAADYATSYRISDDIAEGWNNIVRIVNQMIHIVQRGGSGPGHFADLDLLEVGNPGMTDAEQASHFALWAFLKSPLMISTNLPQLSSAASNILKNKGVIQINQDSLGQPVALVQRFTNDFDAYAGPLANGDMAVLLVDMSNTNRTIAIDLSRFGIATATVQDLLTGRHYAMRKRYYAPTGPHGSLPLRLTSIVYAANVTTPIEWYEAESATLAGGAQIASCDGCSQQKKVGFVGDGASITFTGVRADKKTQDVRFDYVNCDVSLNDGNNLNVRDASVSVNGGPAQPVSFPLTGYNWDTDVSRNYLVQLTGFLPNKDNTIVITSLPGGTQYAPDFDRVGVVA